MNNNLLAAAKALDVEQVQKILTEEGFGTQEEATHILCCVVDQFRGNVREIEKCKEIISLFVENGFNISTREPWDMNPEITESLFEYCGTWGVAHIFGPFLKKFGVTQDEMDCALRNAVYNKYPRCAEVLVSIGANPAAPDKGGKTALMLAAQSGRFNELRSCLRFIKDDQINATDNIGRTALSYCVLNPHIDCFYALIAHGAKLDVVDNFGKSLYDLIKYHLTSRSTYCDEDREVFEFIKKRVKH